MTSLDWQSLEEDENIFFFPRTQSAPASVPAADNVKQGGRTALAEPAALLPPTLPASPTVPVSSDGVPLRSHYVPACEIPSYATDFGRSQSTDGRFISDNGFNRKFVVHLFLMWGFDDTDGN